MILTGKVWKRGLRPLFLFLLSIFATGAVADSPRLSPPLVCDPAEICVIQQYPDADPGPGARDFSGGPLSYDGHQGTDFRVADYADLTDAPPVLAPAPGRVLRLRNDVPDGTFSEGQDCGNGLVLDHGDGLTTQLCHLAQGSIKVRPGEQVQRGQPVGRIGTTGRTEFPHVHLTVRKNNSVVDPFVEDLWRDPLPYSEGGFLSAGFSDKVPDYLDVKAGTEDRNTLQRSNPLVLWGYFFGGRAGDTVIFEISGPSGVVFSHETQIDRTQAQAFRAAGRRPPDGVWPVGVYIGSLRLIRDGAELDRIEADVSLR